MKLILKFLLLIIFSSKCVQADYNSSINQMADALSVPLKGQTVEIELIKERFTNKRLKLSDQILDDLSSSLTLRNVIVILSEADQTKGNIDKFHSGIIVANNIIVGSIQKTEKGVRLSIQAIDRKSGKILVGKTVLIPHAEISNELLRSIDDKKLIYGKGVTSISYQCLETENPCPPRVILIRRADRVATLDAYRQISEKTGVPVETLTSIENGRVKTNIVRTKTNKKLIGLDFQEPVVKGDQLSIEIRLTLE